MGADPDDLAFVTNATTGINTVARSLQLERGDEIVVTDHTYNAARNALETVAMSAGARLVTATIRFPDVDDPLEAILRAIPSRTRLLLLDHVLHVRRDRRNQVRPLVISHGANSSRTDRDRFRLEHDWTGTFDPSAWLAVPAAIAFGAALLPGGWPALMGRGHALALYGRDRLCAVLGTLPPVPDDLLGSMAAVPLPELSTDPPDPASDALSRAFGEARIQVVVTSWPQRPAAGEPWRRVIRLSATPYTDEGDLDRLATVLAAHTGAR